MKNILALSRMELFFSIRRSGFYIYYLVLFGLSSLFVHALGGAFPQFSVTSDTMVINGPQFADVIITTITLITTFMAASLAGSSAMRDYRYGSHEITFTYPISRLQYILGKFTGIYLANLLLFTAPLLGYALTCSAPWLNRDFFVAFNINTYADIFLQKILVNIFFLSAIFYTLGLLLRNTVINWIGIIACYVLYYLGQRYYERTGTRALGALLDPYGLIGTLSVRVGNSADQQATEAISLKGLYLWNRVIWTGIGLAMLLIAYWRFRFSYQVTVPRWLKRKRALLPVSVAGVTATVLPPAAPHLFGAAFARSSFISQLRLECRQLFRNIYFWLITGIGIAFLVASSFTVGQLLETPGYPTTIRILETYTGVLHIFLLLILMVFSGEVVWRDKQYRLQGMVHTTPSAPFVRLLAKTTAIYLPVLLMLGIVLISGIALQLLHHYYDFNIGLYLKYLFGYSAVIYLYYAILAIALQSLVGSKYHGYFLFAAVYIILHTFGSRLIQDGVFTPGHFPELAYSDISGFQGGFYPFYVFAVYWLLLAILIWRAGVRLWAGSGDEPLRARWAYLYQGGVRRRSRTTLALAACFMGIGAFIWYNTHVLNEHHSSEYYNRLRSAYERSYARYKGTPQLSLTAVNGDVALFPENRTMNARIRLTLVNKSDHPIQSLYLNYNHKYFRDQQCSIGWKPLVSDPENDFYGYQLARAVQPGDSIHCNYNFIYEPGGFTDEGVASMIYRNGTFINNTVFLPTIGYDPGQELSGNKLRKKYGLSPKPYEPVQTDPVAVQQNMLGQGADRIRLALTLSTVKGQTAIAPGYLSKSWTRDGRAYFQYALDAPAVNYFSVQSGVYAVKSASYTIPTDSTGKQVQLSIYHHPAHAYNTDLMMQSMKDALAYYTEHFGPYQYRQLRIIEFPSLFFAQSFANTIPFAENVGFLADLRDTGTAALSTRPADYVYYVTAHEVAHQWWAHQILPANTDGANFLSEALSQYSAMMLMKHRYGEERTRKFLELESFNYLSARTGESREERPLKNVLSGQQYIFYEKGACMLYALQHYIGEAKINGVLQGFVKDYAFRERPYITADALVSRLAAAVPDSLRYLVDDCLGKIVLYDNKISEATYTLNDETLEYTVEAAVTGKKLAYNNKGRELEVPMNDWVTIGIYNSEDKLVATRQVKLASGRQRVVFSSSRRPAKLMMNPDYDLLEKEYLRSSAKTSVKKKT